MATQHPQKRLRKDAKASKGTSRPNDTSEAQKDRTDALKAELDKLLDEVDEVLETNAEEFVNGYVQKGGQ